MNRHMRFTAKSLFSVLIGFVILFLTLQPLSVNASKLFQEEGPRTSIHPQTGALTFLGVDPSQAMRSSALGPGVITDGWPPSRFANYILEEYSPQFGIKDPSQELRLIRERADLGLLHARYQQVYREIPVFGGEIIVNMNENGALTSMSGEASPGLNLSVVPFISGAQARDVALGKVAEIHAIPADQLTASEPALWILDERLIQPFANQPPHLVWRMDVEAQELPIRELVLVNAKDGTISLHFNQIDTFWGEAAAEISSRHTTSESIPDSAVLLTLGTPVLITYDSLGTDIKQHDEMCNSNVRICTSANAEANNAHAFAFDTYGAYETLHTRDSIDNAGMTIISNVDWEGFETDGDPICPNAFWDGDEMTYCDGVVADDIAAHEMTHGVTDYESNLLYWYQSGAISESFSDIWGEYVDQTNSFDVNPGDWVIGEDSSLGAIRNLQDPTKFNDPDKMSSAHYIETSSDYGGVHTNNGINNKAVYLMVAGGKFGTKTYNAIGWDKTLDIYYLAQTRYLSSGSDYLSLYNAVDQACRTLLTGGQVTGWDCQQVRNALDAVEMNKEPATNFNPKVPLCPSGYVDDFYYFSDDMETDYGNWRFDYFTGGHAWSRKEGYSYVTTNVEGATYGNWSLYADWEMDYPGDNYAGPISTIDIPTNPKDTYLHFAHAYNLPPTNAGNHHAGGVLEYSIDAGATRKDAIGLWNAGKNYTSTISSTWNSVLGGRKAFTGISNGYVESRYKLNSLGGKSVSFYWRFANGDVPDKFEGLGWWVDNVKIYTCSKTPAVPTLSSPINSAVVSNATIKFDWKDVTPAPDHYQIQASKEPGFYTILLEEDTTSSAYVWNKNLDWNTTYYWRVRSHTYSTGESAWSTAGKFKTKLQPPSPVSPDGMLMCPSSDCSLRPTFVWTAIPGAVSYTIQVSTSSSFSTSEISFTTPVSATPPTNYTHTSDLKKANTKYYWHVKANSSTSCNCTSDWSFSGSFTSVNPPGIPTLVSPANKALVTDYTPFLDWNESSIPSGTTLMEYEIVISKNPDLSSPVIAEFLPWYVTGFEPASNLDPRTTYYWRVRAWNMSNHISKWSTTWSFKTAISAPVLLNKDEYTKTLKPVLDWDDVANASGYTVEISRSPTFISKDYSGTPKESLFPITKDMYAGTLYYWRVRTNGPDGPSAWSAGSFTTGKPPTRPTPAYPIDNQLIYNYTPPLLWSSSSLYPGISFDYYEFVVATDSSFNNIHVQGTNDGILNNRYDILNPLNPNYTYYWRVRGFNTLGQYSAWSDTEKFRTAYSPPFLEIPINGETVTSSMPNFMWSHYEFPTNGYLIQVADNLNFSNPIINATSPGLSYQSTKILASNKTYYWRVQAQGVNGPSYWSGTSTFYTANYPAAPLLVAPLTNTKPATLTPKFDWKNVYEVPGVTIASYFLQVSRSSTFNGSDIYEMGITNTEFTPSVPLTPNVKYYWRVYAVSTDGFYSVPSTVWSFTTLPAGPNLIAPLDGETVSAFTFQWSAVSNAKNYSLQVSTTSNFSSLVLTKTITGSTSYTPIENLPYDTVLYWRVKANFTLGMSAWSEVFTFRIY